MHTRKNILFLSYFFYYLNILKNLFHCISFYLYIFFYLHYFCAIGHLPETQMQHHLHL